MPMDQASSGWDELNIAKPAPRAKGRPGEWFCVVLIPLWLFGLIFPAMIATDRRQLLQVIALGWPIPFYLHFGRSYFVYSGGHRGSLSFRVLTLLFVAAYVVSSALSVDPL